jgi:hypothetical protein
VRVWGGGGGVDNDKDNGLEGFPSHPSAPEARKANARKKVRGSIEGKCACPRVRPAHYAAGVVGWGLSGAEGW